MKVKKEYLILGVVIAALAVYLYQRSSDRTHYTLPQPPALAAADVAIAMGCGADVAKPRPCSARTAAG